MSKLFRFVALGGEGSGDWNQRSLKVAIRDIKYSPTPFEKYGSFTVEIRSSGDSDSQPGVFEVFTNCNLNPNSENYVAKRIGDKYLEWTDDVVTGEKRHKVFGNYDNVSKLVRVEMNSLVEEGGVDPESLPFGFLGPVKYKAVTITSGSAITGTDLLKAVGIIPYAPAGTNDTVNMAGITDLTASIVFPELRMRVSSSQAGVLNYRDTYFGVVSNVSTRAQLNEEYVDLVRVKPFNLDTFVPTGSLTEFSTIFTLDDVNEVSGAVGKYFWQNGSRVAGGSITAVSASYR